jgi:hypothetical protein
LSGHILFTEMHRRGGSTMVELSPHHPKVKGSKQAATG